MAGGRDCGTTPASRTRAREVVGVGGASALSFADLALDPALLAATPLSLFRYPLAWAIKSPKTVVPFLGFIYGLAILPSLVPAGGVDARTHRYVASGAENAVSACVPRPRRPRGCVSVAAVPEGAAGDEERRARAIRAGRVRGRARDCERAGKRDSRGKNARTVVAILGAAHLNGVQARLLSGGAGDALEAWEK